MEVTPDEAAPESLPGETSSPEGVVGVSTPSGPARRNVRGVYGARRINALLISSGGHWERTATAFAHVLLLFVLQRIRSSRAIVSDETVDCPTNADERVAVVENRQGNQSTDETSINRGNSGTALQARSLD
jgi:hypothetical protein